MTNTRYKSLRERLQKKDLNLTEKIIFEILRTKEPVKILEHYRDDINKEESILKIWYDVEKNLN